MNYDVLSSDFSDFHSMIRINIEKQSKAKKNDLQIDWDKDTNWLFFLREVRLHHGLLPSLYSSAPGTSLVAQCLRL